MNKDFQNIKVDKMRSR